MYRVHILRNISLDHYRKKYNTEGNVNAIYTGSFEVLSL